MTSSHLKAYAQTLLARRALVLLSAAAIALALFAALRSPATGDYQQTGPVNGDNPGPAIAALTHGDLSGYAARQPLMGMTSLLLRAPAAAVADGFGGSNLLVYRLGALACLLGALAGAAYLIAPRGAPLSRRRLGAVAAIIVLVAPATAQAVHAGHPEELLAAVLVSGAVVAARDQRSTTAAVALGLAVATKQWALIGVVPVLIALGSGKARALGIAAAVAAALTLPAVVADPGGFRAAARAVGGTHLINPLSAWWSVGEPLKPVQAAALHRLPLGLTRASVSLLVLLLAVAVPAALALARPRLRRRLDPLALLALLALLRAGVDSLPLQYYFVAPLVALAVWETVCVSRLPVVTALTTATVAAAFSIVGATSSPGAAHLLVLVALAALAVYLGRRALSMPAIHNRKLVLAG